MYGQSEILDWFGIWNKTYNYFKNKIKINTSDQKPRVWTAHNVSGVKNQVFMLKYNIVNGTEHKFYDCAITKLQIKLYKTYIVL